MKEKNRTGHRSKEKNKFKKIVQYFFQHLKNVDTFCVGVCAKIQQCVFFKMIKNIYSL